MSRSNGTWMLPRQLLTSPRWSEAASSNRRRSVEPTHCFRPALCSPAKCRKCSLRWPIWNQSRLPRTIRTSPSTSFLSTIHGGQQQWGVNYWETHATVVDWMAVRLLLILAEIEGLETRSIDFVLAFPQADLDVDVFMELPMGMDIDDDPM